MKKLTMIISVLSFALFTSGCADIKKAGRDIGHATKEVTKDIGHASRDAAKDVKKSVE